MSKISLKKENIYLFALDKLESGDFVTGINWLYRALPSGLENEIRTELGIAYCNIGQYNYALKELFLAYAELGDDYDILKNIIRCYIESGRMESAFYYIKYCLDKGIFDDDDIEPEYMDFEESPHIGILDSRDKSQEILIAQKLIFAEQFDCAEELLESIDESSYQYIESRNFLSMLYLAKEKPDEALKYCEQALEKDSTNIMALSHKFTALHLKGDYDARDEVIELLDDIKISDVADYAKLAVGYRLIDNDEKTMECFDKLLNQMPYERDYMICAAQASFNCGKIMKAKRIITDALNLFPFDVTIRYYAREISKHDSTDKFEILPVIPASEAMLWFTDLDKLINMSFTAAKKAIRDDKSLDMKIRWVFQNDFTAIQISCIRLLIKSHRYRKYFCRYLLDPYGNLQVKREIICAYMTTEPDFKKLAFTIDEKLKISYPRISTSIRHHKFFPAYCKAFSLLIMTNIKFVTKLNRAFDILCQSEARICSGKKTNYNALAAVLLNRTVGQKATEEKCCENMECDMTDFKVYKELIYGK